MATTDRTLREMRRMRLFIDETANATTRELTEAWAVAWDEVASEFRYAIAEMIAIGAGEWPTRAQITRLQRAQNAMKIVAEALDELAGNARVTIAKDVPLIVRQIDRFQEIITRTQLPEGKAGVAIGWDRVDERALTSIVNRTTKAVTSALRPVSAQTQAVIRSVLIRGVAVGDNPNRAADIMMRRTRGAFEGGRHRAVTIAQTELLDASRAAALQSRKENSEVLRGWSWLAQFDSRTCPSCLSMHGRAFPLDEPGPNDHPRGRCTAMPLTKTWRQLGIDLDEPDPVKPADARAWFDKQSRPTQERIMGKKRLKQLQSGQLSWDRLSVRRENPGWRPSHTVRPLGA